MVSTRARCLVTPTTLKPTTPGSSTRQAFCAYRCAHAPVRSAFKWERSPDLFGIGRARGKGRNGLGKSCSKAPSGETTGRVRHMQPPVHRAGADPPAVRSDCQIGDGVVV